MRAALIGLLVAGCVRLAPGSDRRDGGLAVDEGPRVDTGPADRPDQGVAELGPGDDAADLGPPPDGGDEAALYPEIVGTCARGWSPVFRDAFDGPLTGWASSPAPWRTESGELVVDLMQRADYWSLHLVRQSVSVEQLWVRVDMSSPMIDAWPQIHLRVSAAFPEEQFFGVRLRGDLAGVQLVRQSMPGNHTSPEAERIFDVNLAFARFHRVVASARTLADGRVRVAAGVYDARMRPPRFKTDSLVEHTYPANEAYGPGSVALSGWVGVARFDDLTVYGCD